MADIVQFPQTENQQARQLQNWVAEIINEHPDKNVAKTWAAMAAVTCQQFPSAPWPTQETLSQEFMESYFADVNTQLLAMHKELLTLQKLVAEQKEGYGSSVEH